MRPHVLIGSLVVAAVSTWALPQAAAHHSFSAVFDRQKAVELTGTVSKVEWTNPHVWFYVDVKNDTGGVENWGFEMGSPAGLIRRGWNHTVLQTGQVVTVAGLRARDGSLRAAVRTVTLSTGESLVGAQVIQ